MSLRRQLSISLKWPRLGSGAKGAGKIKPVDGENIAIETRV